MAGTITLTLQPFGSLVTLLCDGKGPGLERYYRPAPGDPPGTRGYTAFYWTPEDVLWVAEEELDRLRQLARGRRKPFAVEVATTDPIPGLHWFAQSCSEPWARRFADQERARELQGRGR
jgi:hypothetical protein